jgi:hypothetical protein
MQTSSTIRALSLDHVILGRFLSFEETFTTVDGPASTSLQHHQIFFFLI